MATLLDGEIWEAIREHTPGGAGAFDEDEVITHIYDDPCKACARYVLDHEPELEEKMRKHVHASSRGARIEVIIDAAESYKEAY
jgi:hypothetical protein